MADFVKVTEMPQYKDLLDELLDVEEGLKKWEIEFLETLCDWEGCFTKPQARTLNKIYERMF